MRNVATLDGFPNSGGRLFRPRLRQRPRRGRIQGRRGDLHRFASVAVCGHMLNLTEHYAHRPSGKAFFYNSL
jgi:hypothetical protein